MKVLITGVAGLIGSNLAWRLLGRGDTVIGIDDLSGGPRRNVPEHADFTFYQRDITVDDLDEPMSDVDVVFHLAAYSSVPMCQEAPSRAASINIVGSIRVLEAMRRAGTRRLISAETSAIYEGTSVRPTPESEDAPQTVYAYTKRSAAQLLRVLSIEYDMDLTTLRYFNVYGANHDYDRVRGPVIPSFIRAALLRESATVYGDGSVSRDFIHVDDITDFHVMIIDDERTFGETYNLGSGSSASVVEIHDVVAEQIGFYSHPQYIDVSIPEAPLTVADATKARDLGWSPRIELAEGIERCVIDAKKFFAEAAQS